VLCSGVDNFRGSKEGGQFQWTFFRQKRGWVAPGEAKRVDNFCGSKKVRTGNTDTHAGLEKPVANWAKHVRNRSGAVERRLARRILPRGS